LVWNCPESDKVKIVKIGLVQARKFFDKNKSLEQNGEINFNHSLQLLKKFNHNDAHIIIFPELYPFNGTTIKENQIEALSKEAERLNSYIIVGETYKGKYNSATIIDKSGVVDRHFKINLWYGEKELGISQGKKLKVFKLGKFKVGILICYDFYEDIFSRKLVEKGAEIIIVPSASVPAFLKYWTHDLIYQSYKRLIPIVYVNAVLYKSATGEFYGGGLSKVVVPFKKIVTYKEMRESKDAIRDPKDLILVEMGKDESIAKVKLDLDKYTRFRKRKFRKEGTVR
jgi:predicted amidohydrolase